MYDTEKVPYFPFTFRYETGDWIIKNPLNKQERRINISAYRLLQHCNGSHTWGEIIHELSTKYQDSESSIHTHAEPFLSALTTEGMLWWSNQKIAWWPQPPPVFILWNITNRCNLRCLHCAVGSGAPGNDELSLEECKKFIDDAAAYGVNYLILSGGEPLVRRDFFSIADYAYEKGITFQLATNGTLITKEKARHLASLDACAHVSLDAVNPRTHDQFRQSSGAWKRTTEGIRHLVDAGVPVIVGAVVTRMNIREIPDLYRFSDQLGDVTFRILPFIPYGRGKDQQDLEVTPQEMRTLAATLLEMKKTMKNDLVSMEFECTFGETPEERPDPHSHIGCAGAISYCEVMADGSVFPCSFFDGVKTENIREIPFPWIWENSRFLNYFRSLTVSDIKGSCQKCNWLSQCRGSCIAANFIHGDIFQSNCHCWLVYEQNMKARRGRKPAVPHTRKTGRNTRASAHP